MTLTQRQLTTELEQKRDTIDRYRTNGTLPEADEIHRANGWKVNPAYLKEIVNTIDFGLVDYDLVERILLRHKELWLFHE